MQGGVSIYIYIYIFAHAKSREVGPGGGVTIYIYIYVDIYIYIHIKGFRQNGFDGRGQLRNSVHVVACCVLEIALRGILANHYLEGGWV